MAAGIEAASAALFERSWRRAWPTASADALRDHLMTGYAEPHRRYHSLQHLAECLALFESARHLAVRPAEVEIALWFHDAIYDPHATDNEARSADWASEALREAGAGEDAADRVHALVMATRHHAEPATPDEQLLVDIDLSILGADESRFSEYERQIREEYGFVPEDLFGRKRGDILQGFLDRPQLYATKFFREARETAARGNLWRALGATSAELAAPPAPVPR